MAEKRWFKLSSLTGRVRAQSARPEGERENYIETERSGGSYRTGQRPAQRRVHEE